MPSFLDSARSDLKLIERERDGNKDSVKRFVHSFIPEVQKERLISSD
jgi:hypothetical protein